MMAPPYEILIDDSDHPRNSSYNTKISGGCGRSRAQLCLQKILQTIQTIPPPPAAASAATAKPPSSTQASQNDTADENRALKAEHLCVPPSTQMEAAAETVNKRLSRGGGGGGDFEVKLEKVEAFEEINNGICESNKKEAAIENDHDCLGLLIEAAKMIFGEFKKEEKQSFEDVDDVPRATRRSSPELKRRNQSWPAAVDLYEDMEPVVRSKRGRTQVLPCKYRDSIVEPLTRVSRNRSAIIANNKRRLR